MDNIHKDIDPYDEEIWVDEEYQPEYDITYTVGYWSVTSGTSGQSPVAEKPERNYFYGKSFDVYKYSYNKKYWVNSKAYGKSRH